MQFRYPARLERYSDTEVVVSFRDIPWCHTSGRDGVEALTEAADALEEAIAWYIDEKQAIPMPSSLEPGEHLVQVPINTAAKAALAIAFRESGLTRVALAKQLGVNYKVISRMLDPRHGTSVSRINDALRALGKEAILEIVPIPVRLQ